MAGRSLGKGLRRKGRLCSLDREWKRSYPPCSRIRTSRDVTLLFFFFFFFFFLFSFQLNDPWTSSFEQRKRRELSFGFCRSLWLVLSYWLFHFFFFSFLFVCTDLNLKKFDFLFRFNVKVINFIINEIILSYRLVIYWLLKMFNWIIPLNF